MRNDNSRIERISGLIMCAIILIVLLYIGSKVWNLS
jgi:hypothetical protein